MLAPLFQGEWRAHGETLDCGPVPPPGAIRLDTLIEHPTRLADIMRCHAAHWATADLRPVASAWSLRYLGALLPPVMAAASLLQQALPVAPAAMHLMLGEHGEPLRFHMRDEGMPLPGTDTTRRYRPLIDQHLGPLFAALHHATRVPTKLLWGNASRYVESILEHALTVSGHAARVLADQEQLLGCKRWPDGTPNPLHGWKQAAERRGRDGAVVRLHRQCCLQYLLPGEGQCGACPLTPRPCRERLLPLRGL